MLLAVSLLLGAVGGYLHLHKSVKLVVDGEAHDVRTFSLSVGQLLERQGISVGDHDELSSSLDAAVSDGMTIRLDTAKEITLVLNGRTRNIWVTGTTVQDVLEQIRVRGGRGAYVSRSRSATIEDGDVIEFREAMLVRLRVGAKKAARVITNAPTVGFLLDSLGIAVRPRDRLRPGPNTDLRQGVRVVLTRVRFDRVVEGENLPFQTETRYSDRHPKGQRIIEQAGRAGLKEHAYRVRYENGVEVGRVLLSERLVRSPVTQVVVVGTRPPNVAEGVASWYDRSGMVAAHKSLPFGTRVTVTNLSNGQSVTVVIDDRGPFVQGRIIDLSDDAFARLAPLGSGTINVRISW